MLRSEILSIGSYVPENVITNEMLSKMMDTSDEWITQRTGIKERRWASPDEVTSDLALKASLQAIKNADIKKEEIEFIIFATLSPDHEFPGTGCFLEEKLNLPGVPTLDIRQQCSGFIYGLSIADQYIRSGMYKKILVVGSELHSRGLDKSTRGRDTAVLFGDGGGAAIIGAREVTNPNKESYIMSTHLHADGSFAKDLWVRAPGSAAGSKDERITHAMLEEGLHYPFMNGKKVFTHAVKRMAEVILECLQANNIDKNMVDLFFFHQANLRINDSVANSLEIPLNKVYNTIHKYGNTTAATIPLGMSDAISNGILKKGMLVVLTAFGSGFTWSSCLLRF